MDGSELFYRNWTDYQAGFGRRDGEFWLGEYLGVPRGMKVSQEFFCILPLQSSAKRQVPYTANLSILAGPRAFSSSLHTVHFPFIRQSYLFSFLPGPFPSCPPRGDQVEGG